MVHGRNGRDSPTPLKTGAGKAHEKSWGLAIWGVLFQFWSGPLKLEKKRSTWCNYVRHRMERVSGIRLWDESTLDDPPNQGLNHNKRETSTATNNSMTIFVNQNKKRNKDAN